MFLLQRNKLFPFGLIVKIIWSIIFFWLLIREHGIQYIDKMQDIKKLIEETIRVAGIKNRIKFYTHYSDED